MLHPDFSGNRCGRQRGFSLVEAIVVIVITGILFGIVGIFIVKPVQGYYSSTVRAELTDVAANAVTLIGREVHQALPNSVRVDATNSALEFIPTTDGGRYRSEGSDRLDFTAVDNSFDVLGPAVTVAAGQSIVVYNLGAGIVDSDAYVGNNRRAIASGAGSYNNLSIVSSSALPASDMAPPYRFHVVSQPVSYVCSGGSLIRYTNYGFLASQSLTPGGSASVLATNVTSCRFTYDSSVVAARAGLATVALSISRTPPDGGAETVSLYHAIHVDNLP